MSFKILFTALLSDRFRPIKIIAALALLSIMGLYSMRKYDTKEIDLAKCLKDPTRYDLTELEIIQDAFITQARGAEFTIHSRGSAIPVRLKPGETIEKSSEGVYLSLKAVFHKEGYLEAEIFHLHRWRWIKMLTSIVAMLFLAAGFFMLFKPDRKKLIFEER